MYVDYEKRLHKNVIKFKKKADKIHPQWNEMHDNGEWEIGLYEFGEMCNTIFEIIEKISYEEASEQMLDDILFGIARDNEGSLIVCKLLEYSGWYSLLCKKSLAYIYPDKAEKYAVEFWNRDKYKDDVYEDEYQKIMVLHVLHIIHSVKLEKYLDLADKSEYYYLKENAKEIRKMVE